MNYTEFLKSKQKVKKFDGIDVDTEELNPNLFDWQKQIVKWALSKGRAGLFIELWTNPDDIVFTPFLGIGSEAYQALKMGRRAVGIELKESYFNQAVANCNDVIGNEQMKF